MQICYIAPVTTSATLAVSENQGFWEKTIGNAVEGAIQNAIVRPFQHWCYGLWCGFVDISLPVCTTVSLSALMLSIIGVKKARQWIIIPIIVYLFIMSANKMIEG